MKPGAHAVLAAAARAYAPLIALFAFALLATRPAGTGIGFLAGLAFALVIVLHALVFGAGAARRAFPPWACRLALASGLGLALLGAGAARLAFAPQLIEAGAFAATAAAAALITAALFRRAPTLRDGE